MAHGEWDCASVANRHKSQSPQDRRNGNNIQNQGLHVSFVNYFRVAFIQLICLKDWISKISNVNNVYTISVLSSISLSPGRWGPVYSSITETKAHECLFMPKSVFDSTWNSSRILQNQMLSIRRLNAPFEIPGGRMKTKSWRLDFCNFFNANGQEEMRCSCRCFVHERCWDLRRRHPNHQMLAHTDNGIIQNIISSLSINLNNKYCKYK